MMFDQRVVTVAEGDYVIQLGKRAGTWPGGCFRGIDIPGGDYEYDVAFMYRFREGRIAERWAVRDDLEMILQLTNASPKASLMEPREPRRHQPAKEARDDDRRSADGLPRGGRRAVITSRMGRVPGRQSARSSFEGAFPALV